MQLFCISADIKERFQSAMGWGSPDSCSWTWDQDGHLVMDGPWAGLTVRNLTLYKETVQEGSALLWLEGHSRKEKRSLLVGLLIAESGVEVGWRGEVDMA